MHRGMRPRRETGALAGVSAIEVNVSIARRIVNVIDPALRRGCDGGGVRGESALGVNKHASEELDVRTIATVLRERYHVRGLNWQEGLEAVMRGECDGQRAHW